MVELPGSCVSPLCSQPGRVALTPTRIYFQPFNISSNSPVEVYQLNKAGHPPLHPHPLRLPDPKSTQCTLRADVVCIEFAAVQSIVPCCDAFHPLSIDGFSQAQALIKRTYLLKDVGLEIFFSGRNSLYLTFKSTADRDRLAGKALGPTETF